MPTEIFVGSAIGTNANGVKDLSEIQECPLVSGGNHGSDMDDNKQADTPYDEEDPSKSENVPDGSATAKKIKKKRPKKKSNVTLQTDPPTVDICKIFKDGKFPLGELIAYSGTNSKRTTDEEVRQREVINEESYNDLRRAAEVHRQTRGFMSRYIKPGMKMIDICEKLEDTTRMLINENGLDSGIGFPTGVSLNECAAHYTPNPGDETVLSYDDVMKLDFGTHVKGLIIDSAFTLTFNPKYDPLLSAVREATNTGIKEAGIDSRFSEIGAAIQEVMESHQIELDGKIYDIKCVRNLCGHSIGRYKIHAGRTLSIVKNDDDTKMEEGELYAVETFGTTGRGYVVNKPNCSHYMLSTDNNRGRIRQNNAQALYDVINKRFSTLPFCKRYLERIGQKSYVVPLSTLVRVGLVDEYPPLSDIKGSYVAQFEHSVLLRPTQKEVLSRGTDY